MSNVKKRRGWTHIGQEEFSSVKALQAANLPVSTVHKATGRSHSTIQRIYNADTLERYVELTKIKNGYIKKDAPVKVETVEEPEQQAERGTFYTPNEQSAIELTRIANALERLADAWETSPKKKFF